MGQDFFEFVFYGKLVFTITMQFDEFFEQTEVLLILVVQMKMLTFMYTVI